MAVVDDLNNPDSHHNIHRGSIHSCLLFCLLQRPNTSSKFFLGWLLYPDIICPASLILPRRQKRQAPPGPPISLKPSETFVLSSQNCSILLTLDTIALRAPIICDLHFKARCKRDTYSEWYLLLLQRNERHPLTPPNSATTAKPVCTHNGKLCMH